MCAKQGRYSKATRTRQEAAVWCCTVVAPSLRHDDLMRHFSFHSLIPEVPGLLAGNDFGFLGLHQMYFTCTRLAVLGLGACYGLVCSRNSM